jgi:hypothetical protein
VFLVNLDVPGAPHQSQEQARVGKQLGTKADDIALCT